MTSTLSLTPPTAYLPSIRTIRSQSNEILRDSVLYLRRVYSPEVRGSRRRGVRRNQNTGSSTSRSESSAVASEQLERDNVGDRHHNADVREDLLIEAQDLDFIRSDEFERSYAIRWLTALVAYLSSFEVINPDGDNELATAPNSTGPSQADLLLEDASSLLAICSGSAGAGVLTRDVILPTSTSHGSENPIVIHLRDIPLDNADYGSLGAQTWGGACVLAELIAEDPKKFALDYSTLPNPESDQANPLRVLELGAGTGLVSLAVAKVIERLPHRAHPAEVVATDFYPSVIENMISNIRVNFPSQSPFVDISGHSLDWSTFPHLDKREPPLHEPFDIVFGADIIYEALHATWIKECLELLLKKPSQTNLQAIHPHIFHLLIPLRSTHTSESSTVETVFPSARSAESVPSEGARKLELVIYSRETFVCDTEDGGGRDGGEVVYAYYQIGWGET